MENTLNGAPGKIRTPDPLIRSQVLYPAELPVLTKKFLCRAHWITGFMGIGKP